MSIPTSMLQLLLVLLQFVFLIYMNLPCPTSLQSPSPALTAEIWSSAHASKTCWSPQRVPGFAQPGSSYPFKHHMLDAVDDPTLHSPPPALRSEKHTVTTFLPLTSPAHWKFNGLINTENFGPSSAQSRKHPRMPDSTIHYVLHSPASASRSEKHTATTNLPLTIPATWEFFGLTNNAGNFGPSSAQSRKHPRMPDSTIHYPNKSPAKLHMRKNPQKKRGACRTMCGHQHPLPAVYTSFGTTGPLLPGKYQLLLNYDQHTPNQEHNHLSRTYIETNVMVLRRHYDARIPSHAMLTPDRLIKHDYPTPYMTQPSDLV
jgi:hypothetical protein